jgi:hypothetical protein
MIDFGAISPSIIVSNLFGGLIALLIAVYVSRREANEQAKKQRQNWYRSIHNICVRAYGGRDTNHRMIDDAKQKEYAQLYRAFSEQIEARLVDAPTTEVDLPLFNALQNIQLSCIRYANEVETANPSRVFLQNRHKDILDYCLICMYIIEREKEPNIELLHELEDDGFEDAEERYEEYVDGGLHND